MTSDSSSNVALRGIAKFKRTYETKGLEIKVICGKGALAIINPTSKFTFFGMIRVIDKTLATFEDAWENAVAYAETHNIAEFPSDADKKLYDDVKMWYYESLGYHEQLVQAAQPPTPTHPPMNISQSGFALTGRTLLPKINIAKFNGDFSRWSTFKQLFNALVIEEETLSDAERFHFLLSYLEGPPLDTIKYIPVSETNFQQAWQAILQVYDNKRKLANSYIERLLSFKNREGNATADSLQHYLSHVMESTVSLQNLNIPSFADYILCELALRHLDLGTRKAFELSIVGTDYPTVTALREFVQNRCQVLRIMPDSTPKPESVTSHPRGPPKPNKFSPKPHNSQALLASGSTPAPIRTPAVRSSPSVVCYICKQSHIIADCPTFTSSTPTQRLDALKQFAGCRNCLHPFHKTKDCQSKWTCRYCKLRHHSDLHVGPKPLVGSSEGFQTSTLGTSDSNVSGLSCASTSTSISGVLLGTIRATLIDARGKPHVFRGILDAGSQFSFITVKCARKLGKTTRPYHGTISGVNAAPLTNITSKMHITFLPLSSTSHLETEALVVPSITPSLPQISLDSSMWHDYKCFGLSDPDFTTPAPISFLIGADLYPEVVTGVPLVIHDRGPRLMETVFGFTVMGRFICDSESTDHTVSLLSLADPTFQVEQFWEIEEPLPPSTFSLSAGEEACENHFSQSHYRTDGERYVVSLPFIDPSPHIVPNIKTALNRFHALEAKLAKNEQLRHDYHLFMKEYLCLNHMSLATTSPTYLIPHHPIYKLDREGKDKLRVVFDASFRTATGSLNDHLYAGPKLQADICTIMLNFRRFNHVLTCDIVKMFRQILVKPDDRHYQQIAWRFDPRDDISYYELNTVTYGVRSSPYQAQRVLKQLAFDEGSQFPAAAVAITDCIYVDDLAVGSDSIVDRAERHSSFLSLVRVLAYVRRFLSNARIPKRRRRRRKVGPLSSSEFGEAHITFIKLLQRQYFPEVYTTTSNDELSLELRRLAIFRDHEGVIRVGGRLFNAPLSLDQRHPILLPARSHFTNLVVDHLHRLNNHPGPTAMLAFIRQQYWVPKARNLVRLHKLKCITCIRFSKSFVQPIMGNLPISRVSGVRPFFNCGVDFAGPFVCREIARRNSRTHKCYLCVFICMASRAVHLELCTSLSVEAFLDVLDRFVARRGIPSRIHSDCGTNFVGASRYLREVKEWISNNNTQDAIINHTSHLAVEWSFNPPGSPHFGGSWESAVKSAKTLLVKTLGSRPFSQSELHTLFAKVEGVLNSRPLQPLTESSDDAEALTPGHFTIGQAVNAIPEPDFSNIPENRLDRWQLIRERVQHFWHRWRDEYLSSLQERKKWTKQSPNLKIGDVVIIRGINASPTQWPLGRIVDVHPGTDETVRVVSVKTKSGIFKRSAVNLIPLHVSA